jgi:hypothetical protein
MTSYRSVSVTGPTTPGRLGTPAPPSDRGQVTGGLTANPTRGLGAGAAAFCKASPALPLTESFSETDASAIRATASAVVYTTAYRHRVTFAVLQIKSVLIRYSRRATTPASRPTSIVGRGAAGSVPCATSRTSRLWSGRSRARTEQSALRGPNPILKP